MIIAPKFKQWVDNLETIAGLENIIDTEGVYAVWFDTSYVAVLKVISSYLRQTDKEMSGTCIGSFELLHLHKGESKIPLDSYSLGYLEDKLKPILVNKTINEWNNEFKLNIQTHKVDSFF